LARPHALNGVTHLDARLAPVAGEVEHIEAVKLRLPLEQLRDGGGDVGQIGPGVADSRLTLVQNRADGLAGLDQALREPAVAGRRSEEVAGAHDERAHTVTAGGLEPISSSFHINNAPQVSLSSNRKWCLALSQDCSFQERSEWPTLDHAQHAHIAEAGPFHRDRLPFTSQHGLR